MNNSSMSTVDASEFTTVHEIATTNEAATSTSQSTTAPFFLDVWLDWLKEETWRIPVVGGLTLALLVLVVLLTAVCCVRRRRSRRKRHAVTQPGSFAGAPPGIFLSSTVDDDDDGDQIAENIETTAQGERTEDDRLPDSPVVESKTFKPANHPKPLPAVPSGAAPPAKSTPDTCEDKGVSMKLNQGGEEFVYSSRAKSKWNTPKFGPRPMPPPKKSQRKKDSLKRSRHNRGLAYAEVEVGPTVQVNEGVISTQEPTLYAKIAGTFQLFTK